MKSKLEIPVAGDTHMDTSVCEKCGTQICMGDCDMTDLLSILKGQERAWEILRLKSELVLVNSDNLEDAVLTAEAYKEYRLQTSTGDFHTHTAVPIVNPTEDDICNALYWDHDEQALMSGAFDGEES